MDKDKLKSIYIKTGIALGCILALVIVGFASAYAYAVSITPEAFAYPKIDHSHFRLVYVYRGEAENFGLEKYQVEYRKDICNVGITDEPIHFHDTRDQIVHLHWQGMRGGDVLKFYGYNRLDERDDLMGYRLDAINNGKVYEIKTHSKLLPNPSKSDNVFVYSGDENGYQKRSIDDFTNQTVEEFFGKDSLFVQRLNGDTFNDDISFGGISVSAHNEDTKPRTAEEQAAYDTLINEFVLERIENNNNEIAVEGRDPKEFSGFTEEEIEKIQEADPDELLEINNLLGNVVIFVQPNEPTDEQIRARFANLVPLGLSQCGG